MASGFCENVRLVFFLYHGQKILWYEDIRTLTTAINHRLLEQTFFFFFDFTLF